MTGVLCPDLALATARGPINEGQAGRFVNARGGTTGQDFSSIARNVTESIEGLPGLISGLAYLIGMLLGVLGILKVKDHVENPQQAHLKEGAVRMAAGGALFALPIVYEAMLQTIGPQGTTGVRAPNLNPVTFSVR